MSAASAGRGFVPALLALLLLGAGLAAGLYLELQDGLWGGGAREAAAGPPRLVPIPTPPAPAEASTADPTGEWATTILARPLFEPQRRPPTPSAAEPVATAPSAPPPRLTGVLVGPFGRSAIFANPSGGKPVVVEEGGRIGGYLVQSIRPDEATLVGPDGQRVLRTAFDQNASTGQGGGSGADQFPGQQRPRQRGGNR